jgi:hypothetical protein
LKESAFKKSAEAEIKSLKLLQEKYPNKNLSYYIKYREDRYIKWYEKY